MKRPKKLNLVELRESARLLTRQALENFIMPDDTRGKLVVGSFSEGDSVVFELYIAGERPSDAVVITRVRLNAYTGEVETPVEVFELKPKPLLKWK